MQAPEVVLSPSTVGARPAHLKEPRSRQVTVTIPVLPAFLRRWVAKIQGLALILIALIGGIALATWTISDPSLTFANGSNVENWMGFWGASFADFSMQFVGFAAIALLLPPLIWGVHKLAQRPITHILPRLGYWVTGLLFTSTALACLTIPTGWPLQVGLGGVIGDAILGVPYAFIGAYPDGILAFILCALFAIPAAWLMIRACDLQGGITLRPPKPKTASKPDPVVEQELIDEAEFSSPEHDRRDWGAFIMAPVGLFMHLGYSFSAMWRNKRAASKEAYGSTYHEGWVEPMIDAAGMSDTIDGNHAQPVPAAPSAGGGDFDDESIEVIEAVNPTVLARAGADGPDDEPIPHTDAAQPQHAKRPAIARRAKPKTATGRFILPAIDLLSEQKAITEDPSLSNEVLEENARLLEGVLEDFGVKGQILKVRPGPVVTLYELEPAPGVKSSRVIGLAEDIARSMSAIAARVAVVPGRNAIGIELPNKRRETVYLREQLSSPEFKKTKAKLAMCLGKTIGGEPVIADLAKMPHLLVAGTTGSGKSVAINTMILSLLYRLGPEKCKLIMIDPKMLELSIYDGIPHLLTPVVVDPKKAVVALKWTVREMEERYKKMSKVGVRNIDGFNTRINEAIKKGEVITRTVQTGFDRETGEAIYEHEELDLEPMPFIVVIIDEMADLMMVAGKDIEGTVQRLAQMARAAGIHVIMATQRPSVDVITGTIKANFPTRISFQVTSKIDSRTILGEMGAEQLLGMGDMLYMAGGGRITRVHGPFVDDQEVEDVVNHLKAQGVPQYLEAVTEEDEEEEAASAGGGGGGNLSGSDDPYDKAVAIVLHDRKASTSYIQRRLSVGYNKAASLIERMEQEGLISPANHAGKREILVPAEDETI